MCVKVYVYVCECVHVYVSVHVCSPSLSLPLSLSLCNCVLVCGVCTHECVQRPEKNVGTPWNPPVSVLGAEPRSPGRGASPLNY